MSGRQCKDAGTQDFRQHADLNREQRLLEMEDLAISAPLKFALA